MTTEEAKKAIEQQAPVHQIDNTDAWGTITALSNDETTAYYRPRGVGSFRQSATLTQLQTFKKGTTP